MAELVLLQPPSWLVFSPLSLSLRRASISRDPFYDMLASRKRRVASKKWDRAERSAFAAGQREWPFHSLSPRGGRLSQAISHRVWVGGGGWTRACRISRGTAWVERLDNQPWRCLHEDSSELCCRKSLSCKSNAVLCVGNLGEWQLNWFQWTKLQWI